MLKKEDKQQKFYDDLLERIVPEGHIYRKLKRLN